MPCSLPIAITRTVALLASLAAATASASPAVTTTPPGGRFFSSLEIPVGVHPTDVAAGSFGGDSGLDLVTCLYGENKVVLLVQDPPGQF